MIRHMIRHMIRRMTGVMTRIQPTPLAFALPFLLGLAALPATADDPDINRQLASIDVIELRSRTGQALRNELIDRLDPAGVVVPPEYRLRLRLQRTRRSLAVQLNDDITRRDLVLSATATLQRIADGKAEYRTAVTRVASYNITSDTFATLVAERDAERRAAVEVAVQLRTLLALHFEQRNRLAGADED